MNNEIAQWKANGRYFNFEGKKIFYYQDGDGENLLILHGYPYNSFEWNETITEFAKTYKVTIVDLLGMGFSDKPKNHLYSFEEYSKIVNTLLKNLVIRETHIVSHDFGVNVAQELLARAAENTNDFKINSSAFINGMLFGDKAKAGITEKIASKSIIWAGRSLTGFYAKMMFKKAAKQRFGTSTKPSEKFLNYQWEILMYNQGKHMTSAIMQLIFEKYNYFNRWITAMCETDIPMCYICGPSDRYSGINMAVQYVNIIPDPQVYLLGMHIGHCPHLEDRQKTVDYVYQFITELEKKHNQKQSSPNKRLK